MEFLIDRCIVSKQNNITKITPIALYKNNINNLIKITTGNRVSDNDILTKLAMEILDYEDLVNIYNQSSLIK